MKTMDEVANELEMAISEWSKTLASSLCSSFERQMKESLEILRNGEEKDVRAVGADGGAVTHFVDGAGNSCVMRRCRGHVRLACEAGAFQLSKADAALLAERLTNYAREGSGT